MNAPDIAATPPLPPRRRRAHASGRREVREKRCEEEQSSAPWPPRPGVGRHGGRAAESSQEGRARRASMHRWRHALHLTQTGLELPPRRRQYSLAPPGGQDQFRILLERPPLPHVSTCGAVQATSLIIGSSCTHRPLRNIWPNREPNRKIPLRGGLSRRVFLVLPLHPVMAGTTTNLPRPKHTLPPSLRPHLRAALETTRIYPPIDDVALHHPCQAEADDQTPKTSSSGQSKPMLPPSQPPTRPRLRREARPLL